jgi:hypothetical protein
MMRRREVLGGALAMAGCAQPALAAPEMFVPRAVRSRPKAR